MNHSVRARRIPPLAPSWLAFSAAGWGASIGLAALLYFRTAGNLAAALAVGLSQWLVLRNRIRGAAWWGGACALACFAGIEAGNLRSFLSPDPYLAGGVGGAVAGLLQWLVLRRQVRGAIVWIPTIIASWLAGWITGTALGWSVFDYLPKNLSLEFLAGGIAGGLVFGLVSLPALIWLLRSPAATTPQS